MDALAMAGKPTKKKPSPNDPQEKKNQLNVLIPRELDEQLRARASTEERSLSKVVERAIKDYLSRAGEGDE